LVTLDFVFLAKAFVLILPAVPTTVFITATSSAIGFGLAVLLLFVRINPCGVATQLARFYVSFFRGTPLMLHIFLVYYGLPHFFDVFAARMGWAVRANVIPLIALVIVAFSLNAAAYMSEILRGGVLAVGHGEVEAARSIGMTPWQTLRRILLPQAITLSLPGLGSRLIALLHGSSLAFWISVIEITGKANLVAASTYQFVEAFIAAALIYWLITFVIEKTLAAFERKHRRISARGFA
jgi:L-cystine transport system permease protein